MPSFLRGPSVAENGCFVQMAACGRGGTYGGEFCMYPSTTVALWRKRAQRVALADADGLVYRDAVLGEREENRTSVIVFQRLYIFTRFTTISI